MQSQTILNFPFLLKVGEMSSTFIIALISSSLDNILHKCMMHVHSWLMQLNGAIILSAGCIQKGTMFCGVITI